MSVTIRIQYDGTIYDLDQAMQTASNESLINLKRATRWIGDGTRDNPEFPGVTIPSIRNMFISVGERLSASAEAEEAFEADGTPIPDGVKFDEEDLLGDDKFMLNLPGIIYLCRRHAGDDPDLSQVNDISLAKFAFPEEPEDEAGADPKALTTGQPVEDVSEPL